MNLQRIEKSFHDDDVAAAGRHRAIEIEQHLRFPEAGRKTVLGFFAVDRASDIGNQLALLVANRDHATTGKKAIAVIHPYAKQPRRSRGDSALRQIGMPGVNPLQGKTQGAIGFGTEDASAGARTGAGCDARTLNQSCSRRPASRKLQRSRIATRSIT